MDIGVRGYTNEFVQQRLRDVGCHDVVKINVTDDDVMIESNVERTDEWYDVHNAIATSAVMEAFNEIIARYGYQFHEIGNGEVEYALKMIVDETDGKFRIDGYELVSASDPEYNPFILKSSGSTGLHVYDLMFNAYGLIDQMNEITGSTRAEVELLATPVAESMCNIINRSIRYFMEKNSVAFNLKPFLDTKVLKGVIL